MTQESYNTVPYPSLCYTQTHPDRLATIATLLGMQPAPVEYCRVLELGAAGGGNLIPMAYALPHSTFLGIDYAEAQVAQGQAMIAGLGLRNVRLEAADINELDETLGEFDYIIAHGVYSWTPPPVREKVLSICQHHLAPNGVAYISYNALPGWNMLLSMREMMLFHTRNSDNPIEQAQSAHAFISTLTDIIPSDQVFGSYVQTYANLLETRWQSSGTDALLLHDELEAINQPFYFHEFMERAAHYGLQYVAEADFPTVMLSNFEPAIATRLLELAGSDLLALEQYMDFARNRTLRQTLLTHQEVEIRRDLTPDPARMADFFVASTARIVGEVEGRMGVESADKAHLITDHPISKIALTLLIENAPQSFAFPILLHSAREVATQAGMPLLPLERDAKLLASTLLRGFTYSTQLVELHRHQPQITIIPTEKPCASHIARWQAAHHFEKVTNLRHERVHLEPLGRRLLPLLDGQRSVMEIVALLSEQLVLHKDGVEIDDPETIQQALFQDVVEALHWLGRAAILQG